MKTNVNMRTRIREHRKAANMTQVQLAELSGVHRTVIARAEEGRNFPDLKTLLKLSNALHVPVDALVEKAS